MKKSIFSALCLVLLATTTQSAWGETGTITFGTNDVNINTASVSADDNLGNSWTITTVGTTSFTAQPTYCQVGSGTKPATSITFTTTLASSVNITAMSAKFGGFSNTTGTITFKVGDTKIGSGALNGVNDVTVESTTSASGTTLTVTITGINKGVKCYNISYTYETGSTPTTLYLGLFLAAFVAVRACVRRVECLYATFHHIIMSKIDFRSVHFAKALFVLFFLVLCCFLSIKWRFLSFFLANMCKSASPRWCA